MAHQGLLICVFASSPEQHKHSLLREIFLTQDGNTKFWELIKLYRFIAHMQDWTRSKYHLLVVIIYPRGYKGGPYMQREGTIALEFVKQFIVKVA